MIRSFLIKCYCKQHLSSFSMTADVSYDDPHYEFDCL